MLEDLYNGNLKADGINLDCHNWDILSSIYKGPILFRTEVDVHKGFIWRIQEKFNDDVVFDMIRQKMTLKRYTNIDNYGLLGLSQINKKDRSVILTEGVSDYFTAKILCPDKNVLGVTTLTGSHVAKTILVNMFDFFTLCSDNDTNKDRNTGMTNSSRFRGFLEGYQKTVNVFLPADGFKDISDNYINILKQNG